MTLVPLAADLIRRATQDPGYEITLFDATAGESGSLLGDPVETEELHWLSAGEWAWFEEWRLSVGWSVDPVVLDYIDERAQAAEMRHRVVTLALRAAEREIADNTDDEPWLSGYADRLSERSRTEQKRSFARRHSKAEPPQSMHYVTPWLREATYLGTPRTLVNRHDPSEWPAWLPVQNE